MDIVTIVRNAARQVKLEGAVPTMRALARHAYGRCLEKRLGIYTEATIELAELGISNKECRHYAPTDYFSFRKIIGSLGIDPRQHTFVDFGAGMGRAMILAAMYPFQRVLGVEISKELADIARANLNRCRRKLQCRNIDITVCDATLFKIPADGSILYFFNPFSGKILAAVLDNVRDTVATAEHQVTLVCNVPRGSLFEGQVLQQNWLELKNDFALPSSRHCLTLVARRPPYRASE